MNYTLAKRLKDAGFPQKSWTDGMGEGDRWDDKMLHHAYAPTLSELIDECKFPPDIFPHEIHLSKFPYGVGGYKYQAYVCCQDIKTDICDSPEEAVAKLWLALNTVDNSIA